MLGVRVARNAEPLVPAVMKDEPRQEAMTCLPGMHAIARGKVS